MRNRQSRSDLTQSPVLSADGQPLPLVYRHASRLRNARRICRRPGTRSSIEGHRTAASRDPSPTTNTGLSGARSMAAREDAAPDGDPARRTNSLEERVTRTSIQDIETASASSTRHQLFKFFKYDTDSVLNSCCALRRRPREVGGWRKKCWKRKTRLGAL